MSAEPLYGPNAAKRAVGILLQRELITKETAPQVLEALLTVGYKPAGGASTITCKDCGGTDAFHQARPERCKRCHRRHSAREIRIGQFHATVKTDSEKLEAHRRRSRESAVKYRARKKAEMLLAKAERIAAEAPTGSRSVVIGGDSLPRSVEKRRPVTVRQALAPKKKPKQKVEAPAARLDAIIEAPQARYKQETPRVLRDESDFIHRIPATPKKPSAFESCAWCFRKFKGDGLYCSDEHEQKARAPEGHDGRNFSRPYNKK